MIRAAIPTVLALTLSSAACMPTVGEVVDDPPGGGSNDFGPDANCATINFTATPVIPSVQLLIDRSGSMDSPLPNTNTSIYQAMRDALVGMDGVVTQLQAKAHFGASMYDANTQCPEVVSTPSRGLNNFTAIQQLIDSQFPRGNTPTAEALDQTIAGFMTTPAPMGSPPIIVLATDGLPGSCNGLDGQQQAVAAAQAGYAKGIRTFILGIAGVNDAFLQDMANAGQGVTAGQPNAKYFTANSPADLKSAFQQVVSGVVSCELAITGTVIPEVAKTGTVLLNGMPLMYGTQWEFANDKTIRLLGAACDQLKNGSQLNATVQASFPCGAVIL
jgi:hypothetical protein